METSRKKIVLKIPKIDVPVVEYEIPPMPDGFYEDVLKMFRREWGELPEYQPRRTKPMRVSVEVIE